MSEKVIATRKEFLEWNETLKRAVPTSETSVEYREACFIFRSKVEKHIMEPAREIFKEPEDVTAALKQRSKEIYETGLSYALEVPINNGDSYKINPDRVDEWKKVSEAIDSKYASALEISRKNDLEFEEWCDKKVQLNLEKIELSKMPSFDSATFYNVAKILCNELPENEEDGVVVE